MNPKDTKVPETNLEEEATKPETTLDLKVVDMPRSVWALFFLGMEIQEGVVMTSGMALVGLYGSKERADRAQAYSKKRNPTSIYKIEEIEIKY